MTRRSEAPAAVLLALGLAGLAGGADAPTAPPPPRPSWSSLRFEASTWVASIRVEFELQPEPEAAASGGAPASWLSIFRTRLESKVLARKSSETQVRFDPGTGRVPGYQKLVLGPTPNRKVYEFSAGGARRTRIEPGPGEAVDRPAAWTAVRTSFHPFDARALGCEILSEPTVLVYEISSGASPAPSLAGRVCVFTGKTLFRARIDELGSRRLDVDYEVGGRGAEERRRGSVTAQCYRILGQPVAGESDEEDIHLEFCVDPGSRLPVQLATPIGVLGMLDVRLARVEDASERAAVSERPSGRPPG